MKTASIFRCFAIWLFSLMFVQACSSQLSLSTQNLAPNPSFETAESGWVGNFENVTYTWNQDSAHQGTQSVCMSNLSAKSSADLTTSESIPVYGGTSYTFSTYVRGDFDREAYQVVEKVFCDRDMQHLCNE